MSNKGKQLVRLDEPDQGGRELTTLQANFVREFTTGPHAGETAKCVLAAGYDTNNPGPMGCALGKLPHVAAAIDAALRREIAGPLTVQAVRVIRSVITDENAPLKLRADISCRVVEYSGVIDRARLEKARETGLDGAGPGAKRLGDMTRGELEQLVKVGAGILQAAAQLPAPGAVIDGVSAQVSAQPQPAAAE